jgi:predicted transcriptional regulator
MAEWSALAELAHPGDSIRERRIELGWTQAELAKRTGIPQADISRIENGKLDARWSTIRRISEALVATSARPRRSLANGRMVAESPKPPTKKWSPKGAVIAVAKRTR